jgi:signal transduction histidine kinase
MSLLKDDVGELIGIVCIAKDMRETKRLMQKEKDLAVAAAAAEVERRRASELEKLNQELKTAQSQLIQSAKMAAVGQLGAGVAHELNNPLGGILGYAQFILDKLKRPEFGAEDFKGCSKYLDSIEREAARCKGIVENLLKFSRRPIVAKPEALDIAAALADTLSIIGHQLKLKNIKLTLDIKPDLFRVIGIINQLQQVFTNLILNAQQAMPESGELKITAYNILDEKTKTPTQVRIEFQDTGTGIPEENLAHLFEPFFTTKLKEKGTGLGLAVSYQIIQDHKGTIEVTSQVGKGTTVAITLPAGGKR